MLTEKAGVAEALDSALVGFLTTVTSDGQPQTSTVWFHRQGEDLIVYSRPDSPRMRNLEANHRVAFNLRADPSGSGVLSIEGQALVEPQLPPADSLPGYVEKYLEAIESLGYTPATFAAEYSSGIRIEVTRLRAFGVRHLR
jgi:PPOX class probable F420-dependent enzyme